MHKVVHSASSLLLEIVSLSTPQGRLLVMGGLAGFLALLGPNRLEHGPTLCIFRRLLGRPCPACGMTRAMAALTRGQPRRAARYNRLVFPAAATLLVIFTGDLYKVALSQLQIEQILARFPDRTAR